MDEHGTTGRSSPAPAEEIAYNLNALFDDYRRAHGRKLTNEEVADHVTRVTGETCDRRWIARLRDAGVATPASERLEAVADYFGRTREYLLGIEDDVKIMRDLRETAGLVDQVEAKGISMRQLADLEPEDADLVLNLLRNLARHQNRRSNPD